MTKYRFTVQEAVEFAAICFKQAKVQFNKNRLVDANILSFNEYLSQKLGREVIADGTNLNFRGAELACANFAGVILDGADFTGANVNDVNFTGASLNHANFTGTKMRTMPNFNGAFVNGMVVYNANIGFGENIKAPNRQKLAALRPRGAINTVRELIEDFDAGKLPVHANYFHVAVEAGKKEAEKKEPKHIEKLQEIAKINEEVAIAMRKEHEIKAAAHLVPVIRRLPLPGVGILKEETEVRAIGIPLPVQIIMAKNSLRKDWAEAVVLSDVHLENLIGAVLSNKTLVTGDELTLAATALKEAEQPKQPEAKVENGKNGHKEKRSFRQKVSDKLGRSHKKDAPVNDNAQEKQVFATAMDKKIWEILNGQEQKKGRAIGAE